MCAQSVSKQAHNIDRLIATKYSIAMSESLSTPLESWTVSPVKSEHPRLKGDHIGRLGTYSQTGG
jgi:hypothetical protein